jgi:type IV pilus assembly protein PilE
MEQTAPNRLRRGFTMIELLIAMVIVVILVSIAFPSYKNYIIRTSRQQAQSLLLTLVGYEEKIFLNSSAYVVGSTAVTTAYNGTSSGGLGLTSGRTADDKYDISVTGTATSFLITATPVAGSTQAGDGTISVDDAGARKWVHPTAGTKSW